MIKNVNFINRFDARQGLTNQLTGQIENVFDTVENIINITGCQAHFIQIALDVTIKHIRANKINNLTGRNWKEISLRIIESVDNDLLNIWDTCSAQEKLLLSCISNLLEEMSGNEDMKPSVKMELGDFALLILDNLNDILKNLTEKSILDQIFTEDEIRYTFTMPLMRDWIRETKNPFEIINKNSIQLLRSLSLQQFIELDQQFKEQERLEFLLSTIDFDKRRWETLLKFSQMWSELSQEVEVGLTDDIEENINKFYKNVKNFANLFEFSIVETIDQPRMTYFKFKTPSITLKKLKLDFNF